MTRTWSMFREVLLVAALALVVFSPGLLLAQTPPQQGWPDLVTASLLEAWR